MKGLFIRENLFHLIKEIIWLGITGMVIYAILYPITSKLDYVFWWKINAFFIFLTITYFRYSVTFKGLPFLRPSWVRFSLFAFNLSLFIFCWHYEQEFVSVADNFNTGDFGFPKVIMYDQVKIDFFKYLYKEFVFFGAGTLVTISAFQLRLIISYWQYYTHTSDKLLEG